MAALLLNADATVEVCHIFFTDDLKKHTLDADIVFSWCWCNKSYN